MRSFLFRFQFATRIVYASQSGGNCSDGKHRARSLRRGGGPAAKDVDTGAQIAPIVKLDEVAFNTGEEDEDLILDMKAKLYRFDKDGNQWKDRGSGTVKFLKHKETGKVHLVMRQSKTLKICANHLGCYFSSQL
ncbi:Ran-binding protein 1-b-like protein [Tripterygium wilfordii]|uniref:Ran-binding protein 1-b-like protein n=1 Tax=Tripterygium wilfordii TaxID=458696 RepID=A0A7J7DDZ1_TRIWF|nr:Ran-binding protein 1-b-like protein [Tripterygium wilfordii]